MMVKIIAVYLMVIGKNFRDHTKVWVHPCCEGRDKAQPGWRCESKLYGQLRPN